MGIFPATADSGERRARSRDLHGVKGEHWDGISDDTDGLISMEYGVLVCLIPNVLRSTHGVLGQKKLIDAIDKDTKDHKNDSKRACLKQTM